MRNTKDAKTNGKRLFDTHNMTLAHRKVVINSQLRMQCIFKWMNSVVKFCPKIRIRNYKLASAWWKKLIKMNIYLSKTVFTLNSMQKHLDAQSECKIGQNCTKFRFRI